MQDADLTARVARLEEQVAHLTQQPAARPSLDDQFAHLAALEADVPQPGGVLMVGSVTVAAGPVRWEWGQTLEAVQESDWTQVAGSLSALAHPVRLTLMKLVLEGTETTGDLLAHPELASTGKCIITCVNSSPKGGSSPPPVGDTPSRPSGSCRCSC